MILNLVLGTIGVCAIALVLAVTAYWLKCLWIFFRDA